MVLYSMYEPRIEDVHKEWASWLQNVFGSRKVTLGSFTFRPKVIGSNMMGSWTNIGRQYVDRAAQRLHGLLLSNGSSGIVVVEAGTVTGRLHLHTLSDTDWERMRVIQRWWEKDEGFVALRGVHSERGVSMYVTKYVTKSDLLFYAGGPLFVQYKEAVKAAT